MSVMLTERLYNLLKEAQSQEKGTTAMLNLESKIESILSEFPFVTFQLDSKNGVPTKGLIIVIDEEHSNALMISLSEANGIEVMTTSTAIYEGLHKPSGQDHQKIIGVLAMRMAKILDPTHESHFQPGPQEGGPTLH